MISKRLKKRLSVLQKKVLLHKRYLSKLGYNSDLQKNKTIVVCIDGAVPHGGLVDRLKGIVSFYFVAKELGYNFKILHSSPFDLAYFLEPNLVDWQVSNDQIRYNPLNTKILYLNEHFDSDPLVLLKKSSSTLNYVYSNVDYLQKFFPELNAQELKSVWSKLFWELFKYSDKLKKELDRLPRAPYSVFHTRFTSLMGDFKDTTSMVLQETERAKLLEEVEESVSKVTKAQTEDKFYLLSDSQTCLDFFKSQEGVNTLEGSPKHIGVSGSQEDMTGHMKTFTDFFFIASADKIYLIKKGLMYNSAFSKYAAIIGDKPFEILD
jgi:hypothetical protein